MQERGFFTSVRRNVKNAYGSSWLYKILNNEFQRIERFAAKKSTCDEVKIEIKDFLRDENTGLTASFVQDEADGKKGVVFRHLMVSEEGSNATIWGRN